MEDQGEGNSPSCFASVFSEEELFQNCTIICPRPEAGQGVFKGNSPCFASVFSEEELHSSNAPSSGGRASPAQDHKLFGLLWSGSFQGVTRLVSLPFSQKKSCIREMHSSSGGRAVLQNGIRMNKKNRYLYFEMIDF
ncbi:hypothetical protein CEXT_602881 [Caerostris extrusa]|uniref:Uncharacterized protein n=1 Tax=Caerostris extrusa TaxID=172846 RepID=A0AAV4R5W8_CAEEX|nr:hypothetical protein CEXT_602881 [Caerostris extrusa]